VDLLGLGTLVKYGSETLFGYVPKKVSDLAAKLGKKVSDMPLKVLTSDKVQEELRTTLQSTYEQLSIDLVAAHKAYRTKEAKMEKDKLIHGNITEQKQQDFDAARKLYEKLLAIVTTLSECIGQAIPVLEVKLIAVVEDVRCGANLGWLGVPSFRICSLSVVAQFWILACVHRTYHLSQGRPVTLFRTCVLSIRWRKRRRTAPADSPCGRAGATPAPRRTSPTVPPLRGASLGIPRRGPSTRSCPIYWRRCR
jgi:hypothetical protein